MRDKSVVLAGYFGFGNAGDELILRACIDHLKADTPDLRITVLSHQPERTRNDFGVDAVDRWRFWQWIRPLAGADRFILAGGGLLQEATGPWNHAYYLLLIVLARLLGCRAEARAIGVDPIRHRINRWWTRWVFNWWLNAASVRDLDSQRALEAAGVRLRLTLQSDWAFQLSLPSSPASAPRSECIGLALAPWPRRVGWDHDLALLVDRIVSQLGVGLDLLVFFPREDEALARKVCELARQSVTVRSWTRLEEVLAWMADYQLIIGMRYHALVLAALAEKPFVGWGVHRKVRNLCRDFRQPMWMFDRGWDTEVVFRQLSDAWRHRADLPERYRPLLPRIKQTEIKATYVPHIFPAAV
jgi:polysaccharide pyruvyl transferase CsaB